MSNQADNRETLKAIALSLVNKVYVAFGKEPLSGFVPGVATEDTDCVIQALEDATGLSLDWGEFDGEKHWLAVWGPLAEAKIPCHRISAAWETSMRLDGDMRNVEIPAVLAEFAAKVALEGDYPELVKE
jgi:hypothetical protein